MKAWFFPGQGTQTVGMGRELRDASPAAAEVFAEADDALGEPLSRLLFEGPAEELTLTANAQPAILATSIAALAALREACPALPDPAFAAGHSLGEYSALVAAGCLTLREAVRLVRIRGEAMQRAVPSGKGAMAAVLGLGGGAVVEVCQQASQESEPEGATPANFNAPGQVVVAGHAQAVRRAGELARARGGKVIPLKVSAPFHCSLMQPAAQAVAEALTRLEPRAPRFPVVRNVDAKPHLPSMADAREAIPKALVDQVCGAVRWQESLEWMAREGLQEAFEFGSGKVLAGLTRKTLDGVRVVAVASPADVSKVALAVSGAGG